MDVRGCGCGGGGRERRGEGEANSNQNVPYYMIISVYGSVRHNSRTTHAHVPACISLRTHTHTHTVFAVAAVGADGRVLTAHDRVA